MKHSLFLLLAVLISGPVALLQGADKPVPFSEVRELIGEHLINADPAELDEAAVKGLLKELEPHVVLNPADAAPTEEAPIIAATNRFNKDFGYVRVGRVGPGIQQSFQTAVDGLLNDGPLRGLVVDLRFAGGADYQAAADLAGMFSAETNRVMLEVAEDQFRASAGARTILIPAMILVNARTEGAAEAAAALLRDINAGLLIGATTAGKAIVFEDFKLSNGGTLRIATKAVKLGSGQPIPRRGITPDIQVTVPVKDDRVYLENPYYTDATTQGSTTPRRLTEADLVRQRREGLTLEEIVSERESSTKARAVTTVTDPSLARALDLLKALAVVETWKQN